ncbi:MAG TPA: Cof-type HAD-IIB family hydrolase [Verrucomicrobiae bacterium]
MIKLAAIDLDGTLLGPDRKISAANAKAIRRLQSAGVRVVLASGRHYHNMRRYAEELEEVQWVASCQGGELCDTRREEILCREFLPLAMGREIVAKGRSLGLSPIVYTVDDILTDCEWNANVQFYAELSGRAPRVTRSDNLAAGPMFKVIWIGEPHQIETAVKLDNAADAAVQRVRTHARLLESMPTAVSKASALKIVAKRLGVTSGEAIAFGDGDNDVPLFEWCGVSVAMSHGWPAAIAAASHITPEGDAETALARGVDMMFDAGVIVADGQRLCASNS